MILNTKSRRVPIAAFLAITLWTAGCTTPAAVREFTAIARDAATQFRPLVKDLTASCIRKQLADRPVDEIEDVNQQAKDACKEFSDLEPNLLKAGNVLVNYLNALNQLASGDAVSYDKEIDGFAGAVQGAGKLGDAPVKAVKGLAKFLLDAAASGYQRKKLASALKAADADVSVLCNALSRIIGEDYDRALRVEKDSLRTRYKEAILSDQTKSRTSDLLVQYQWRHDLETLENRRQAAEDYQKILAKIRDGHIELAAQADHWTVKDVYQTLNSYSSSIRGLIMDFKAAF